MAQTPLHSAAASSYAKALLDLANGQNQAREVGQELNQVRELIDADASFEAFLANPTVSADSREQLLQRAFDGKVLPLMWKFLRLLNVKGRLGLLRQIDQAFDDLLDEQFGKVEVDVTVAQRLSDDELEQVRQTVGTALKRDAVIHQYVDESIIGGLVLRVQDRLIDSSVRAQLAAIKEQMLAARPRRSTAG